MGVQKGGGTAYSIKKYQREKYKEIKGWKREGQSDVKTDPVKERKIYMFIKRERERYTMRVADTKRDTDIKIE